MKNYLIAIAGYEREAANAKTNAESSSSSALTSKETIQELLAKLESGQTQQQELLEKLILYKNKHHLFWKVIVKLG